MASQTFYLKLTARPWPDQRRWNMESIYEYGARAGFWRLHRLFTEYDIPLTIYGVATALARNPDQMLAMQDAGWEIASHGYKWIEYKDFSREEEADNIASAITLHTEVTGERPQGWYTGRCSTQTVDLVCEAGGFSYISDSYADDLPYWHVHQDQPHLIIPYTLDANDMRFAAFQGFNAGSVLPICAIVSMPFIARAWKASLKCVYWPALSAYRSTSRIRSLRRYRIYSDL